MLGFEFLDVAPEALMECRGRFFERGLVVGVELDPLGVETRLALAGVGFELADGVQEVDLVLG